MKDPTKYAHLGRPKPKLATAVNPDITRASTLLFDKAEDLYRQDIRGYGRHGSTVHDAVEDAFNHLEGGAGTSLTPSGLAACTLAIMSCVKAGDHMLVTDSIYGPTRYFCHGYLADMGVETELYDPRIGADIQNLIRPPLQLGADISAHAATKYIGGHSDIMFGAVVSADEKTAKQVAKTRKYLGYATSPDDAYQILRGFRSLTTRFEWQL